MKTKPNPQTREIIMGVFCLIAMFACAFIWYFIASIGGG